MVSMSLPSMAFLRSAMASLTSALDVGGHLVVVLGEELLGRVDEGEDLGLLGGDRGVALDELGEDPALGLDAERQRGDVEQQDVLDLALEHAGLQAGADS